MHLAMNPSDIQVVCFHRNVNCRKRTHYTALRLELVLWFHLETQIGPNISRGRGALEIDIFEPEGDKDSSTGHVMSQITQFAPFSHDYLYSNSTPEYAIFDREGTRWRCGRAGDGRLGRIARAFGGERSEWLELRTI